MSLYPGTPRNISGRWVLDDTALADSMAEAIEDAMKDVYKKVKGSDLPDAGAEDRRLLFVAVARGVLKYLYDHREAIDTTSVTSGTWTHDHGVELHVTMNGHTTHS